MQFAIRHRALSAIAAVACGLGAATAVHARPDRANAPSSNMQKVIERGMPGRGHALLKPLAGTFRVRMTGYMGPGTPEKPVVSTQIICNRQWIAGGRFLHDVTKGKFAGADYYREGLLGFSNVDRRYEWVTADSANANMMIYVGKTGSGPSAPIEMTGTFTDQGWLGESVAGRPVRMRTLITIENKDRHVVELYFTPPGGPERLVDRKVYTRIKK